MTYLLIAFVLAIILSPLLSMRQSKRQKQVALFRSLAKEHGLQVKLSRPADAREGEGRLETAIYRLSWPKEGQPSTLRRAEEWLLVRDISRGDETPWQNWRWLSLPVADELLLPIGNLVEALGDTCSAFEAGPLGLAVYWSEQGEASNVEKIAFHLQQLQKSIRG